MPPPARAASNPVRSAGAGSLSLLDARRYPSGVVSRGDFKGYEFSRHEDERDLWEHMR